MIETKIKDLDINELIKLIKNEIDQQSFNDNDKNLEKILRQKKVNIIKNESVFITREVYTYEDFIIYDDKEFIKNSYRGILKREVDEIGFTHFNNQLKNRKLSREDILSILRYSKEGKISNVNLLGSKKRYLFYKLKKIPLIGNLFYTLFNLSKISKKIDILENEIAILKKDLISNDLKLQEAINSKVELEKFIFLVKSFSKKADKVELENKINKIDFQTKLSTETFNSYLDFNNNKELFQTYLQNPKLFIEEQLITNNIVNDFYLDFEDKFRGTKFEIKDRLKQYLPYIKELQKLDDNINALDLGCGRGEWLELLNENGIDQIIGIDINDTMITNNKKQGLNVIKSDLIEYLKGLKDNSVSIITSFHVVEHIKFEQLIQLFNETYRVLKKDGIVIFETPNPENIIVGSCDFYLDPTHRNPLHPKLIEFLATYSNFKDIEIKRVNGNFNVSYDDLFFNHLVASQVDFSLIAFKR